MDQESTSKSNMRCCCKIFSAYFFVLTHHVRHSIFPHTVAFNGHWTLDSSLKHMYSYDYRIMIICTHNISKKKIISLAQHIVSNHLDLRTLVYN